MCQGCLQKWQVTRLGECDFAFLDQSENSVFRNLPSIDHFKHVKSCHYINKRPMGLDAQLSMHGKSTHTCHIYHIIALRAQINAIFALQATVSELRTILSKRGQRSLSAPAMKVARHYIYVLLYPLGLKLALSLYNYRFPVSYTHLTLPTIYSV